MKNNNIHILIIIFFTLFVTILSSNAEELNFKASVINISENGNKLSGEGDVKVISENGIEIYADNVVYDKLSLTLLANGNVKVIDTTTNIIINSQNIEFKEKNNILNANGNVLIEIENNYFVKTSNIFFDRNNQIIYSNKKTKVNDKENNFFTISKFNYLISKKILRGGDGVTLTDKDNNKYSLSDIILNLNTFEFAGKDLSINFDNSLSEKKNNDPRLLGSSVKGNKNKLSVEKGVFTTCKKRNGKCPPWHIKAEKIEHDKVKKIINYKNAWLNVYDVPVLYFPRFFHPDPTVKRQSGFLIPSFNNSNKLGQSISIPYYKVIAENKDFTFKPKIFFDQNPILHGEYRQSNKNSKHVVDASFNKGYEIDSTNTEGSKTHFFSNSLINLGLSGFDESELNIKVQKVSNDQYLTLQSLKSPLIDSTTLLETLFKISANKKNLSIVAEAKVYENLNTTNNDRYEYILPSFDVVKNFETNENFNGNLIYKTTGYSKLYETNKNKSNWINELIYTSDDILSKKGIVNKFISSIKNVNTRSENTGYYKVKKENELLSSAFYEASFPLKKENEKNESFLIPKAILRYSPNKTKNISSSVLRLDPSNIFSYDRISNNEAVEGGQSLTVGSSYIKKNKTTNKNYFEANIGQIFRDETNEDLPKGSALGHTSSDVVGNLKINKDDIFSIGYDFSFQDDLDTSNYNLIKSSFKVNNFVTSFEFLEERNDIGNESYLSNKTSYNFDSNNSISFSSRKNKTTNLNEYKDLIYQYENDCLRASLEYNKEYYNDENISPEEKLFFSITIVPFGKTKGSGYAQ